MDINFIRGFIDGVILTIVINFILRRMGKARGTIIKRTKPLDTFPDSIQPKITPAKIVWQSTLATFAWVFWLLVLIVVIVAVVAIVRL